MLETSLFLHPPLPSTIQHVRDSVNVMIHSLFPLLRVEDMRLEMPSVSEARITRLFVNQNGVSE